MDSGAADPSSDSSTTIPHALLDEIANGRTDRVFDFVNAGYPATTLDRGVSIINRCAYYGDVSAMRFLLSRGETLDALGENLDLNGACFHGHWQLCEFLIENGADVNWPLHETGESPLHAALCTTDRLAHNLVMKVLLANGAEPNCVTLPSADTGAFMRDSHTKGETPLHRAAAFGDEEAVKMLIDAGAIIESRDEFGETPLAWASWYLRPASILRMLCYGDHRVHPTYRGMRANLQGEPNV